MERTAGGDRLPILFRVTGTNTSTVPLLLHLLERSPSRDLFRFLTCNTFTSLHETVRSVDRGLVVYSFMTPDIPGVWEEMLILKYEFGDRIFTVAGGAHATGDPTSTLKMGFDAVITGDAEGGVFPRFCEEVFNDWCLHRGKILQGGTADSLDAALPVSDVHPYLPPLEIRRGCSFRCRYCQTGTRRNRPLDRSLESIERYLHVIRERQPAQAAQFIIPSAFEFGSDRPGAYNLEAVENLLTLVQSILERKPEYGTFPSELYARSVTEDGVRLLRTFCGNRKVNIGVQSGSRRLLRSVGRRDSFEEIETSVELVCRYGFQPCLDFIIGFPGETEEDRIQTLDCASAYAGKFQARVRLFYFIPLAGTAFYDEELTFPGRHAIRKIEALVRSDMCQPWWEGMMAKSQKIVEVKRQLEAVGRP